MSRTFANLESPFLSEELRDVDATEALDRDDVGREAQDEAVVFERDAFAGESFEEENGAELDPADSIDETAAQPVFARSVIDRVEPLLSAAGARAAAKWNAARHPSKSGIAAATLLTRLSRYVNRPEIDKAMGADAALKTLRTDDGIVLAVVAHQFQRKIFVSSDAWKGEIGEGTLDALGFVRHRHRDLNAVDAISVNFHAKGKTKAFRRLEEVFKADKDAFLELGADVKPKTWYSLMVNAPYLGWQFTRGVHVELMRRLRRAERWLQAQPHYATKSPAEIGAALGIDEAHHGGRAGKNRLKSSSMHTLGLAVDIRYIKNPWVAGQHGTDGKPNSERNSRFQAVTRRVSHLVGGTDHAVTPKWLESLGGRDTAAAHAAIKEQHDNLVRYLGLEGRPADLRTLLEERRQGSNPERVLRPRETTEAAVSRWTKTIRSDREILRGLLSANRDPAAGYMNLHRDLVMALRDQGCLAWGAIDLGGKSNGDMMHFDCRAEGIGLRLSLPNQRTVGLDHPCRAASTAKQTKEPDESESEHGESEEIEVVSPEAQDGESEEPALYEDDIPQLPAGPSNVTALHGGRLWAFTAQTIPMRIAVFVPKAVTPGTPVEVLVFAHGHLSVCGTPANVPEGLVSRKPFELGKIVDASNRQIVLVVPAMDWGGFEKHNLSFEACNRSMHALGVPKNLNGIVKEVLAEVGRVSGSAAPTLKALIVAGHSRAYEFLDLFAISHLEPEMTQGALARLSDAWLLDTSYLCHFAEWTRFMQARPALRVHVFYRPGTGTACGKKFEPLAKQNAKLLVTRASEGHCQVPIRRLPGLLTPTFVSPTPEIGQEVEPVSEETFGVDEDLVAAVEAPSAAEGEDEDGEAHEHHE